MNLFDHTNKKAIQREELAPDAVVRRGFALPHEEALLVALNEVMTLAPFRHMITPGGHSMLVAMTNCCSLGWVTDSAGYRYDPIDLDSHRWWSSMPEPFLELAQRAATEAGFPAFVPDACLINRYAPATRLSLCQDKDEQDFRQPIVSVLLGILALFLFGGTKCSDHPRQIRLTHGDVVVWGGPLRWYSHGVMPLEEGSHP